MKTLDLKEYPAALGIVLSKLPLAPLGPGLPQEEMRPEVETALAALPPGRNADMIAGCRAGLWLAFDFLDESHRISQDLNTQEGSYWHALMHRHEPDYWNSKYWWRKVGNHPVFVDLAQAAMELGYPGRAGKWDPEAFVDACERQAEKGDVGEEMLRRVQRAEWELLFSHCYSHIYVS